MKKRWVALQKLLISDPLLSPVFGDRVGFVRIPKKVANGLPYIVFNEQSRDSTNFSNDNHSSGLDVFPVLIDIVVPYNNISDGRMARHYIRSLIGSYNGVMGDDREGQISYKDFLELSHDSETDNILLGSLYLFKERYDLTN